MFLRRNPVCVDPLKRHVGQVVGAQCVDHIVAHKGNKTLFWNPLNHQAVCLSCNSSKAAKYEGGFGNKKKRELAPVSGVYGMMNDRIPSVEWMLRETEDVRRAS